ncbi:hypothetical protein WH96_01395 [Kiloniella spongiae]|uniref:eCIS core domain-containing protein n=2 Tax=Kiloniella spongiae TaxID=1489064 RepID=A0A0H2MIH9_9PROT|nr:hypothetical protein WH96_01395 [Kiloniella spongiae]
MLICRNPLFIIILITLTYLNPSTSYSWDPIKDLTGERLDEHMQNLANSGEAFRQKPIDYLINRPGKLFNEACAAPISAYASQLRRRANGHWRKLPDFFAYSMQKHFPEQNLRTVRYAEGIRTSNGSAQTFTNEIYFPRRIDLRNKRDLEWMLHELEHVVQYSTRGSQASLLCEYQFKSIGEGFQHITFNPHDFIDLEVAATRKARLLLSEAHDIMLAGGRGIRQPLAPGEVFRTDLPPPPEFPIMQAPPPVVRSR